MEEMKEGKSSTHRSPCEEYLLFCAYSDYSSSHADVVIVAIVAQMRANVAVCVILQCNHAHISYYTYHKLKKEERSAAALSTFVCHSTQHMKPKTHLRVLQKQA